MKLSLSLLTLSTLVFTLLLSAAAEAKEELGLSFELDAVDGSKTAQKLAAPSQTSLADDVVPDSSESRLPVPAAAMNPPLGGDASHLKSEGGYGGGQALALDQVAPPQTVLPAPPQTAAPKPSPRQVLSERAIANPRPQASKDAIDSLLLGFDLDKRRGQSQPSPMALTDDTAQATAGPDFTQTIGNLFQGGSESLVARAIGSAEGTRTPEGHKTPAYFGHVDPGNGAWNLGSFSYQHSAKTPDEADTKQLNRLRSQTQTLSHKAEESGLNLSLEELLNGLDLANQAPEAALDREGYIDWLARARQLGMNGAEAIVWARTRSFIDPDTQRWNAPGLGNNIHSIAHDQSRRAKAIYKAVKAQPAIPSDTDTDPATRAPIEPREKHKKAQEPKDLGIFFGDAFTHNSAVSSPGTAATITYRPSPRAPQAAIGSSIPADTQIPVELQSNDFSQSQSSTVDISETAAASSAQLSVGREQPTTVAVTDGNALSSAISGGELQSRPVKPAIAKSSPQHFPLNAANLSNVSPFSPPNIHSPDKES